MGVLSTMIVFLNVSGVEVLEVFHHSVAEKIGLEAGDCLESFDGHDLASLEEFSKRLISRSFGEGSTVRWRRDKKLKTEKVVFHQQLGIRVRYPCGLMFGVKAVDLRQRAQKIESMYQVDENENEIVSHPDLRQRLFDWARDDQRRRAGLSSSDVDDRAQTEDLRNILVHFGWPGKTLVGQRAAGVAWLICQHSDHDLNFQKVCLEHLKKAVDLDEAEARHQAYLEDRIAIAQGRPQRYGAQYGRPILDIKNVDALRNAVGLEPLGEYLQRGNEPMPEGYEACGQN